MKALIAYFSRPGENYFQGTLRVCPVGNTRQVACQLADITKATVFEIAMQAPYAHAYNTCLQQAKMDLCLDVRPPLCQPLPDLADVDVLYLGFPNYWGTMPVAVMHFLECVQPACRIRPFCTHEGSGFGKSLQDLHKLCPDALVEEGCSIYGHQVSDARPVLEAWLARLEQQPLEYQSPASSDPRTQAPLGL